MISLRYMLLISPIGYSLCSLSPGFLLWRRGLTGVRFGEGLVLGARAHGLAFALPAPPLPLSLVVTAPSEAAPLLLAVVAAGTWVAGAADVLRRGGVALR